MKSVSVMTSPEQTLAHVKGGKESAKDSAVRVYVQVKGAVRIEAQERRY